MPSLNVLTWNSNGESVQKAQCLELVINNLVDHEWLPELVFIQEANTGGTGAIAAYLSTCGLFHNPVASAPEGGGQGRSYLMAVANHLQVTVPITAQSLIDDTGVQSWLHETFSTSQRRTLEAEIAGFRNLGCAEVAVGDDSSVRLATWHAPRGASAIGAAPSTLPGGANPDAYVALDVSELYHWLTSGGRAAPGLAGDLNISQDAIGSAVDFGEDATYEVLQGWVGYGHDLDFVLTLGTAGGVSSGFHYDDCGSVSGLSDHDIVIGTVQW